MHCKGLFILSVMMIVLTGCSDIGITNDEENVQNHLIYEGESSHWNVTFEVHQYKNADKTGKYHYMETPYIKYIGDNTKNKRLSDDYTITWEITGDPIIRSGGSLSHFQSTVGVTDPFGTYYETNASDDYLDEESELVLSIQFGNENETIPLHH